MMRKFAIIAAAMLLCAAVPALSGDDLTSKMVNDPSQGWNGYGNGTKAELYDDAGVQGGKAVRLTIAGKAANPWEAGARIPIAKPLKEGDVLLLAFWAKAETPPEGATTGKSTSRGATPAGLWYKFGTMLPEF